MDAFEKLDIFKQYHEVSLKQFACRSFFKQVKGSVVDFQNIMIQETVA